MRVAERIHQIDQLIRPAAITGVTSGSEQVFKGNADVQPGGHLHKRLPVGQIEAARLVKIVFGISVKIARMHNDPANAEPMRRKDGTAETFLIPRSVNAHIGRFAGGIMKGMPLVQRNAQPRRFVADFANPTLPAVLRQRKALARQRAQMQIKVLKTRFAAKLHLLKHNAFRRRLVGPAQNVRCS